MIPVQVDEAETLKAGTPKAFSLQTKEGCRFIFITTLDGPLNTLQLLDENFLIIDQNHHGILFALRFQTRIIPTDFLSVVFASMDTCSQINGHSVKNSELVYLPHLKRYNVQTSENDLVYVHNVWPFEESAVKALGLMGEVKNFRIQ